MKLLLLSFETAEENLAFEDWYFNSFEEDTLRIWRNAPSVIVGKHQNALAEVNLKYCIENDIPVIRRISGGGTVYHDWGNINFSFFRNVAKEKLIDYSKNLELVQKVLHRLGYPVTISERNDLFLGQTKISGNAQHVRKGKALHHGTLLYDANLKALSNGIKRVDGEFKDKGVKSVRSPIENLRAHLDLGSTLSFQSKLLEGFKKLGLSQSAIPQIEVHTIFDLVTTKYSQDAWNFGYSPKYIFKNKNEQLSVELAVERGGSITNAKVMTNNRTLDRTALSLIGKPHFFRTLNSDSIAIEQSEIPKKDLLSVLF